MLLRNIFLKTLRDNRLGILGWGLSLGLILLVVAVSYPATIGPPGPGRAAQAAQMSTLLQSFSFLVGEIVPLDTLGGFATARILGEIPFALGLWATVVGVFLIRGEEERGALDMVLTTPHSRWAVFRDKAAALGLGLLVTTTLCGLGLGLGALVINEPLPLDGLLLALLNILVMAAFWGVVGLLAGQLIGTRTPAMAAAGGLLFTSYLLDNVFTNAASLKNLAWVLPFHYYSVSKPLVPGRTLEWGAWLVLVAASALLLGLGAALFARRDVGGVFPFLPARPPARDGGSTALLGSVWGKAVRDVIGPSVSWGVGLALFAALIVGTTAEALQPMRDVLGKVPFLAGVIGNLTTNEAYLGVGLFIYLPLMLAVFALTQLAGWTSDEEEGRMETLVSEPEPRSRILLARYAAVAVGLLIILALTGAGVLVTSIATNTPLDAGRVLVALGGAGLAGLVVALGGLALATWLPRPGPALTITAVIVIAMFFLDLLAQIFKWPEAVRDLSIFHLYGRPLVESVAWGGLTVLAVAAVLFGALGLVGFGRRDIAK